MLDRIATRYGTFVATSRVPTFGYVRRLASGNPRDYAVYAFWNVFVPTLWWHAVHTHYKNKVKKLQAENKALADGLGGDLLEKAMENIDPEVTKSLKDIGLL